MSFQGAEVSPEMRKMVVNAKHFFDVLKREHRALKIPATSLTASALDSVGIVNQKGGIWPPSNATCPIQPNCCIFNEDSLREKDWESQAGREANLR